MRDRIVKGFAAAALAAPSLAWAGDTPLYQPAPAWVGSSSLPDVTKLDANAPPVLLFDLQQRIEGGRLWSYTDTASRIATPEMLAQATTLALPWAPDKGDLIVHELTILRGAEKIDVLSKGQKFTILRREQSLEQRELTGILTATLAVEGLQVGDILHVRASVTSRDAALGGRVQVVAPVLAAPFRVGTARVRMSWPSGEKPQWKVLAEHAVAKVATSGGYTELTLALPVPKQTEMPDDAPTRFRHPPLIELSTFADWQDVSKVFAPLYATDGAIVPGSPLAGEVAAIMKATARPIERAERALELVQDKVRYLAVGMDGGNYVPQKPARTWDVRYGDCKAKTVLLLALLRSMGIEAEPVLAHVGLGDLVPERLPSAAAFNHVFVRATIDGQALWLDGTGLGSQLADIHDTPPFGYGLPVRASGATPIHIDTHADARATMEVAITADESGSVDLPSAFDATAVVRGRLAGALTLAKAQLGEKEQRQAVTQVLGAFLNESQVSEATITPDPVTRAVKLHARGVTSSPWFTDDRRRKRTVSKGLDTIAFSPDRTKTSWAALPVRVPDPGGLRYRLTLRLPDQGRGFVIDGAGDMKERVASYDVTRATSLAGGTLTMDERIDPTGGEIPAARIPAERDALATAQARAPRIVAPADTPRRWDLSARDIAVSTQVKAIEATFAAAIANDPDEASGYLSRASFRAGIGDHRGALVDETKAIAIAPSIDLYLGRATTEYELGDSAAALADAEKARDIDPSSSDAITRITDLKAQRGDLPGAVALLDQRIALGGETRATLRAAKANLLGEYGDVTQSIAQYDTLIGEKPGSPDLMNGRCWAKGIHAVMLDTALKDCTSAIELSTDTSAALDSRAMVWFRMGRYTEALADLDSVLASAPSQADSRFLRALVLQRLHREADAAKEVALARRLSPSVDRRYARYGLKVA